MPHRLKDRQAKIQEKRKHTSWRDFLMEVCSRYNVGMYKSDVGISEIPMNDRSSIVSLKEYEQTKDSYLEKGFLYNKSKSFFDQILSLRLVCPLPHLLRRGPVENSQFAGTVGYGNNIYLSFEVFACENVCYSVNVKDSSYDIFNSVMVGGGSNNICDSLGVFNSSGVYYSRSITDSHDIRFSVNMLNCQHCIGCSGLSHKKYCIKNKQYSKEEYMFKKAIILARKDSFFQYYQSLCAVDLANLGSIDVVGQLAIKCTNVKNAYFSYKIKDSHNTLFVGTEEGNLAMHDVASAGAPFGNDYYGVLGAGRGDHYYCSYSIEGCNNMYYSFFMIECSYCLGCIGLKNKSYCIFNRQYTKEERYDKVDEIFSQVEKDRDLGKFFPGSMNPFYFNDTAAYLIDDSFTKEEVEAKGYMRRDEPIKVDIPEGATVVKTSELDQYEGRITDGTFTSLAEGGSWSEGSSWSINPDILKVIIQDEQGNVYRIVQMEYDFLMKHGLPLPRKHWLTRMRDNFKIS